MKTVTVGKGPNPGEPEGVKVTSQVSSSSASVSQPQTESSEQLKGKTHVEIVISVIALIISLLSLAFTLWYHLYPGEVKPLKPSAYSIIREVGPFPSDHLVIPMEWENTRGQPVLVRNPYLVLRALTPEGKETGKELRFPLAGGYPEISSKTFAEHYEYFEHVNSFSLDPHSVSRKVLVFHVEQWWDDKSSLHKFRFKGNENYRVYIGFQLNLDKHSQTVLFDFHVYDTVDRLDRTGTEGYWWDYFSLE